MFSRQSWLYSIIAALFLVCGLSARAEQPLKTAEPIAVTASTPNSTCLDCHGVNGFAVPKGDTSEAPKRHLSMNTQAFGNSAHGKQQCVACHADVKEMPHKKGEVHTVDCVTCHTETAKTLAANGKKEEKAKIGTVVNQIDHFMASVHAQPSKSDPSRPNATCADCHSAHYTFPTKSAGGKEFRQSTPEVCGRCHEKQAEEWKGSVHAAAITKFGKDAATCSDCHTAHDISKPKEDAARLLITRNCGSCHDEAYDSYRSTYHGQVASLGYPHTAKCMDCHEPHRTLDPTQPGAKMDDANRLKVCQTCHKNAPDGFKSFYPHGNNHDFGKYPAMWIASKFMILLLLGVFAVFWSHSALWFYREWQDRKNGIHHLLVDSDGNPVAIPEIPCELKGKHIKRFSAPWRIAHLALAIAVMVLVLSGTSVLYADSFWAPVVMKVLGGPKIAAVIHRICASVFAVVFFGHIAYAAYNTLILKRASFRWFGPYSLLPNWQDLKDVRAMLAWFFNRGPRPTFDHWTYWEKFDYWAPFWGMFIIGLSGLSLWFPETVARFLPGWVFNVATIVHGEEAFLAAVFLFSVHYFNCHFRPSKLPQDLVMFTGTVPLHEFIEERGLEYKRMLESGELDRYLVDPPSQGKTKRATLLGFVLIAVGLILLVLVLMGFWQHLIFG